MRRSRQIVGLLTLLALVAIVVGVTGVQVPGLRLSAAPPTGPRLAGVRALSTSSLIRVAVEAPADSELAFMAVEPGGGLLVSDSNRHTVMRFDASGDLLSEWGPRLGDTQLVEPAGVAVSSDSFWVVDRGLPRLFRLDGTGQPRAVIDLAPLSPYGLNGLAVDANDNVYAADTGRNRILVFTPAGRLVSQVGHGGTDLGGFTQPMMLAFGPDGSLFVADWENGRITRWGADLVATDAWSTGFRPFGVAVDQSGRVFVPDTEHRRVEAYSPRGEPLGEMGGPGSPIIDVTPKQVAVPRRGGPTSLYVLGSDGIQRLDLEDTPTPPPSSADTDVFGVVAMALMLALLGLAVAMRRRRRSAALLGAPPGRPVRLRAEDGAESQYQQPCTDQNLLLAHEPERE